LKKFQKISVCIPTYNRAIYLENCLNSIFLCKLESKFDFQVCISDNNSDDITEDVVLKFQKYLDIKYHKNKSNFGRVKNYLQVVDMADGDFIWLIGDDDLLLTNSINDLQNLINEHPNVDFFYVNSFHLSADYLKNFPIPFDTKNLPKKMIPFSKRTISGELPFYKLIDPNVSFDFLGGMFLSVFRKNMWISNIDALDEKAINDKSPFSHFDNTFPHLKIFSNAFMKSNAYFNEKPLNVCLSGAREWAPLNPLVMSIRLIEALKEFRKNGLSLWRYIYCKNFALGNFFSDFLLILLNKKHSGYAYIQPLNIIFSNMLYPNFYFSIIKFIARQVHKSITKIFN